MAAQGERLTCRRREALLYVLLMIHKNRPELTAQVFVDWCDERRIALHYIQPGKPDQNAFIERCNRSYRTEVLDAYLFEWKCCNFESGDGSRFGIEVSCSHLEQPVDELNLAPHIRAAHPPRLPLPNHVHCLVSLDCPPRRVKLAKPLLGLHSSFDRSMVLLQDIVQVLDRPVSAAAAQDPVLSCWNRRAVEACPIGVDDAGRRMRWIAESLAKQPFGRRSIA